jgi:hypothetical protein
MIYPQVGHFLSLRKMFAILPDLCRNAISLLYRVFIPHMPCGYCELHCFLLHCFVFNTVLLLQTRPGVTMLYPPTLTRWSMVKSGLVCNNKSVTCKTMEHLYLWCCHSVQNLGLPICYLTYRNRAHRYPPYTPFYVFFKQIYVLNFLNMLHNLLFFSLPNAIYFIMLPILFRVLFAFYIQGVLKFKCQIPVPKG